MKVKKGYYERVARRGALPHPPAGAGGAAKRVLVGGSRVHHRCADPGAGDGGMSGVDGDDRIG